MTSRRTSRDAPVHARPPPVVVDRVFLAHAAEGTPTALAQAVQYRCAAALRLLTLPALLAALEAPEEMGADALRRLEDEVAFRLAIDARRRLDGARARRFLAGRCGPDDPFVRALSAVSGEGIAAFEAAWLAALGAIGGGPSRFADAAGRAAQRLSFGHERTVAPLVATYAPRTARTLLHGLVLRPSIDIRTASHEAQDVVLRREGKVGRRFRDAAAHAQRLAMDVTGDRRHFGVSLAEEPPEVRVDGPSCGLAVFAATALAFLHRNPPPAWIGFTGAFDAEGRLVPAGHARRKARAAAAGGLRALFLPEACRDELLGLETPLRLVFLPPLARTELFDRIEREVAALAPDFLRVRAADARKIYARGEELFFSGKKEAEPELAYLARALDERAETDALATIGAAAEARLGRCYSRRGEVLGATEAFEHAEARLLALAHARRLEREGREVLAEFGVWRAITLIDMRDFAGALASANLSFEWKRRDEYTSKHSLARTHGGRGIVQYTWARTLAPGPARDALFLGAEADIALNLELIQGFDRGRVLGYRATLDLYRGRLAEAEQGFRHVLADEVGSEGSRAANHRWALDGLAHTLYARGRAAGDRALYEEAIRVAGTSTDAGIDKEIPGRLQRWRGAALRELGSLAEARDALGRSLHLLLAPWPEGHPKRAIAVPTALEMALLEARAGHEEAARAGAHSALAIIRELDAASLRAHFAPTVEAVGRWLSEGGPGRAEPEAGQDLVAALGRLIP